MKYIDAHALVQEEVFQQLGSGMNGLSVEEVEKRQRTLGLNTLPEGKKFHIISLFLSQFKNAMVLLMSIAALLSLIFHHVFDAVLIFGMVVVNAVMGFIQEYRAEQSIAALKTLLVTKVIVKRNGKLSEVPQEEVTLGDIIQLSEGSRVPADAYILSAQNCYVSESALTGESLPVEKKEGVVPSQTPLADRQNMVWMGTTVTQGNVEAIVTKIGAYTEFGMIATSLQSVVIEKEHFSEKISMLSKQMGMIAITSAVATFLVGYFIRNFTLLDISMYTIATLVSALPEGLPIILVIVLAVGAQRMAKKNAIVRKLSATETLGVVSVIITDKTGTITQNVMSAKQVYVPGQPVIEVTKLLHTNPHFKKIIMMTGVCHQVRIVDEMNITFETLLGDPTERALFLLAHRAGFRHLPSDHQPTVVQDMPFQQQLRLRACLVESAQRQEVFVLGAPEGVLERCESVLMSGEVKALSAECRAEVVQKMEEFSGDGLRVVALASFPVPHDGVLSGKHLAKVKGAFVGLVGLYDPPRPEVKAALKEARQAGIRIVMATGDHPQTALAIAKEIGLVPADDNMVLTEHDFEGKTDQEMQVMLQNCQVLARLTPQSKLRVAGIFQKQGKVVAMTGDGVNDAPALKKADVGIAMGITGTDVAREASKIVLTDDNFASIVAAIKEGRTQFSNLRRTSFFLIMTNVAESAALLIALCLGFPLPLLPIQILWLNVITGGMTDFALSLEPTHESAMKLPPRPPSENILNASILPLITTVTIVTTMLCLGSFWHYLPEGVEKARTALFVILSCSQLLNMFNLRSLKKSVFQLGFFTNKAIVVVLIISFLFLIAALYFAPLRHSLHFQALQLHELILLVLISSGIFFTAEITKLLGAAVQTRKA